MKKLVTALLVMLLTLGACTAADAAGADREARLRTAAEEAVRGWQSELDLSGQGYDTDTVDRVFTQLLQEPELFYLKNFSIWHYTDGRAVKVELHYFDGVTPADVEALEAAAGRALKSVLPGMDALQTALVLHDYLDLHVAYDYENYRRDTIPPLSATAYGALVLGTAVCQGYTEAYRLLLSRCGVENAYVRSDGMNHGWAMVRLGDDWYHVDVTWDDPAPDTPGTARHKYFLLSDAAISDAERGHYVWEAAHACGNTRFDTDVFWRGLDTPVPFTDADTCWLLQETGDYTDQTVTLLRRSWSSGAYEAVASVRDYWPTWDRPGHHWGDAYSGLVLWDGRLFFNDKLHVYAYDPADGTQETVFTYTGGEGYLYGLVGDGTTLRYLIRQDADRKDGRLYELPLSLKYPPGPFEDVVRGDYYFDAVQWAYEQGVAAGTGAAAFSPAAACTRGQVAAFLWRAMGRPAPATNYNPFADVPEDAYYRDAVLWAVEQGITNGTGADPKTGALFFSPDDACSYAHILTFLWRSCTGGSVSSYGSWYSEAQSWALKEGLLRYAAPGTQAEANCPRCDAVTFLWLARTEAE